MAGVTAKIEDSGLLRKIHALQRGLADASPLMRLWGEIAKTSIEENFEVGGRPSRWKRLSTSTIRIKGHLRPLIGKTGNLSRVTVRPESDRVLIGSSPAAKPYAAVQQFGGRAGRGLKVTIPARPYILLQREDLLEMQEVSRTFFKRLAS